SCACSPSSSPGVTRSTAVPCSWPRSSRGCCPSSERGFRQPARAALAGAGGGRPGAGLPAAGGAREHPVLVLRLRQLAALRLHILGREPAHGCRTERVLRGDGGGGLGGVEVWGQAARGPAHSFLAPARAPALAAGAAGGRRAQFLAAGP